MGVVEAETQAIEQLVQRLDPDGLGAADIQHTVGIDLRLHIHGGRIGAAALGQAGLLDRQQRVVVHAQVVERNAADAVDGEAGDALVEQGQAHIAFVAGVPLAAEIHIGREIRFEVRIALRGGLRRGIAEIGVGQHRAGVGAGQRARAGQAHDHLVGYVPRHVERGQGCFVIRIQHLHAADAIDGDRAGNGLVGGHIAHAGVEAHGAIPDVGFRIGLNVETQIFFTDAAGGSAGVGRVALRCGIAQRVIVGVGQKAGEVGNDEAARAGLQIAGQGRIGDCRAGAAIAHVAAVAAAHHLFPGGAVVEAADGALGHVVGRADLDVALVLAELQVGARATRFGLALFVLDIDPAARPAPAQIGVVEIERAGDAGAVAALVAVVHGSERRGDQDAGRCACQPAARGVGLHVELDVLIGAEQQLRTGIDAPELDVFVVWTRFQKILRVGEGGAGHHVVLIQLHPERDHVAVAADQIHADPLGAALGFGVQRVQVEMHAVGGTPFQRHHRRIAIAIAIHVDLAAQARNQGIADLVDAQPRVACQQPRGIDGFAGGEAAAGSGRHAVGNAPVAAAIDVARRRLVGGWRTCRRSEAALGVGEVRIGPAHALEAAHTELAAHRRHTKQCAEGASFIGPAAHEGAARGGLFAGAVPVGLGLIGDVHTGAVERARAAHVHHTGDAAFEHARGGCLAHGELGKEFGGKQIQIDFAVLVLRIQADRGGGDAGAVERGLGEAGAQAADGDVEAFAVDVARQVHARNTVERLGNVHVRKLADIFGKHRVGKATESCLASVENWMLRR